MVYSSFRSLFSCALRFAGFAVLSRVASRLETIVHHLGIALGGRPAATLARRLMLAVSKDTLLRVVRQKAISETTASVRIVGI
jgi:hypothetical protein